MPKTTLYLTRHGQTIWNAEKKLQGHQDSPLTELGILQATWLSKTLSSLDFEEIYASTSLRAQRTAEIICLQRNKTIITDERLREINMGDWEGHEQSWVQEMYPTDDLAFRNTPDLYYPKNHGESFFDVQTRVIPCINEIITRHSGKSVIVITHGITLKIILNYFEGRPLAHLWETPFIQPTALSKISIENDTPTIELYGDVSHYQEIKQPSTNP